MATKIITPSIQCIECKETFTPSITIELNSEEHSSTVSEPCTLCGTNNVFEIKGLPPEEILFRGDENN